MAAREKRVHARLEIMAQVRVSGPSGVTDGRLVDLSKGGAGVVLSEPAGKKGDTLELFILFTESLEIAVMAEIVRVKENTQGFLHGLRFNLIEPAMQKQLIRLIEAMLKTRGGLKREHPRVTQRIPIQCRTSQDLKAVLENVSEGGISLKVSAPLALNQEVMISIPNLDGQELLALAAQVRYQTPHTNAEGRTTYHVGFEFVALNEETRQQLKSYLAAMMGLSDKS